MKAKYNKSRRHCWVILQRGFCRRVGGGLTAPCDESQSHPSRPDRAWHDPGFLEAAGGQGCGEHRGRQVENSAPARPRKRVNTITLPSTPACRHAYARLLSSEDGYRNSLPAARLPRDLRLRERRGERGLSVKGLDIGVLQEASICRSTFDDALLIFSYANGIYFARV